MALPARRTYGLPWLVAAAVVPAAVWQLPFGQYAMLPFSVLATWFHEMGHGVTALVLGGSFHQVLLFPNGSGLTSTSGVHGGRLGAALVAAGGLMGPPVAGFALLAFSRRPAPVRAALAFLGAVMLLSAALWVRTVYGAVMVTLIGAGVLLAAWRAADDWRAFLLKVIGVQACIASFRSRHYMFSSQAVINGGMMHSDTAAIAKDLFLPYWFWGGVLFAATLGLLAAGVYAAVKAEKD
ncbi:MAG: M50 family metallopeptidase [Elusimicrobia bacterium]|nr:M50 family metallopeptidase [Elusimicrobiota bacterium]